MEDKVIIGTKTFRYEVCITSSLPGNGGAHLKMKSTAKTSYAAAELIIIIIIILNTITIRITHKGNIRTIAIFYHQAWNPVLFSSSIQTVTMS